MIVCYENALYSLTVQSTKHTLRSCRAIDVRGNLQREGYVLATEKLCKWFWFLILQMSNTISMVMDNTQFGLAEEHNLDNCPSGMPGCQQIK
jgi:hypothetical protein